MGPILGFLIIAALIGGCVSGCQKLLVMWKDPLDKPVPTIPVKEWDKSSVSGTSKQKEELDEYKYAVWGINAPLRHNISYDNVKKLQKWEKHIREKDERVRDHKDLKWLADLPDIRPGMKIRDAIADLEAFERLHPDVEAERAKEQEEHRQKYPPCDPDKSTNKYKCSPSDWRKAAIDSCWITMERSLDYDWKPVDQLIMAPMPPFEWANKKPNDFWVKRREHDIMIQNDYGAYIRHTVTCYFNVKTYKTRVVFNRR